MVGVLMDLVQQAVHMGLVQHLMVVQVDMQDMDPLLTDVQMISYMYVYCSSFCLICIAKYAHVCIFKCSARFVLNPELILM